MFLAYGTKHNVSGLRMSRARDVASRDIVDGSITTNDLASNSVTTDKIAAGAVTAPDIAAGAVSDDRLAISPFLLMGA